MARVKSGSRTGTVLRWLMKLVLGFVLLSMLLVIIYRFLPPPVTLTMLMDPNGSTRDWMSLSEMDPDMPRAAIAAEDSKFCFHHGFDAEAITKAIEHKIGRAHV